MATAIKIENVSKLYRLGTVGTGTLSHDINRWWHRIRGKEDPYAKIGQVNDRTQPSTKHQAPGANHQETTTRNQAPGTKHQTPRASSPEYVWALKDINLEVAQGEILGIIGRNGAGKSTLLKLLSRVTAPTTGSIKTRGRIASLLEVGTGFHPELTGRENIYLNGAILGMKRHEVTAQLDEIVDFSGCTKYLDTPVKRYSSGMMVRLGFAVAAHLQCEILIVDEVLAVGDAEFHAKCIGKMRDVSCEGGRTVIFVSHNLHAVRLLTDNSIVMANGTTSQKMATTAALRCYREVITRRDDVSALTQNGVTIRRSSGFNFEFDCGMPISFGLTIELERSVEDLTVGGLVSDTQNQRIAGFSSKLQRVFAIGTSRCWELTCDMGLFPLSQGDYFVTLYVGSGSIDIARFENAVILHIKSSDVFGTGQTVPDSWGALFLQPEWSFRPLNSLSG